jgi:hypothetical protein
MSDSPTLFFIQIIVTGALVAMNLSIFESAVSMIPIAVTSSGVAVRQFWG